MTFWRATTVRDPAISPSSVGVRFVVLMTTDMKHGNAMSGQSCSIMPVIAIDCVQDGRVLRMSKCQRYKYTVVTVKAFERRVVRKLDIVCLSYRMGCKRNLRDAISAVTIVNQPFKEHIADSRLTSE